MNTLAELIELLQTLNKNAVNLETLIRVHNLLEKVQKLEDQLNTLEDELQTGIKDIEDRLDNATVSI